MHVGAEGKYPLLGAALLFVAARATKGKIKFVQIKRLLQAFGLGDVRMQLRTMVKGIDVARNGLWIHMHNQAHAALFGDELAHEIHLLKFPARVHVHQWKRRGRGVKRLARQVHPDRTVLANGIQHDRIFTFGNGLAKNVNAFSFQTIQMALLRVSIARQWRGLINIQYGLKINQV